MGMLVKDWFTVDDQLILPLNKKVKYKRRVFVCLHSKKKRWLWQIFNIIVSVGIQNKNSNEKNMNKNVIDPKLNQVVDLRWIKLAEINRVLVLLSTLYVYWLFIFKITSIMKNNNKKATKCKWTIDVWSLHSNKELIQFKLSAWQPFGIGVSFFVFNVS